MMNRLISGLVLLAASLSTGWGEPAGQWFACPWVGGPQQINAMVRWDPDGVGPIAPKIMLGTEAGVFEKGADGVIRQIDLFGFQGLRITSMTTWSTEGQAGGSSLIVSVQDEAFGSTGIYLLDLTSGGTFAPYIPLGNFDGDIRGLTAYDTNGDGTDELIAVGGFEHLEGDPPIPMTRTAVLPGVLGTWSQLGTPPNSTCEVAKTLGCLPEDSVIPCEGDSTLVIGGFFTEAGGQSCHAVACWDDGVGDWVPCMDDSALSGTVVVRDVVMWDAQGGPHLIVAGFGVVVHGVDYDNIAHYDGDAWLPFGDGTWGGISAVTTFDVDGDGIAEPITGATMNPEPGVFPYGVQYWDGINLRLLDNGVLAASGLTAARDFLVLDSGRRGVEQRELIVVGSFETVDTGIMAENIAIWRPDQADVSCNDADFAEPLGVLDFFDVLSFLNLFAAQNDAADLTGDSVFDFFDLQAFLNAFSEGCP